MSHPFSASFPQKKREAFEQLLDAARALQRENRELYGSLVKDTMKRLQPQFNEEYHGTTSKPSNFMRTALYLMSWFEKWGTFDDDEEKVAGTDR